MSEPTPATYGRPEFRRDVREARWGLGHLGCVLVAPILFVVLPIGCFLGWFGEAASVAREEFGPRGALRKYEWFRDAAAQLDKKRADIVVYRARLDRAEATAKTGDRTDRERLAVIDAELAGVLASYNALAAEYNAASEKFNWSAFAGDPLPRQVQPYQEGR